MEKEKQITTTYLPVELHEKLRYISYKERISMNKIIVEALKRYIKEEYDSHAA